MTTAAALDTRAIARVCARHGVSRLRVFGSAVTGRFDPATSDVDFLVDFGSDAASGIAPYLALKADLEKAVGRDIDLVETRAVRNPYFARRVLGEAVDIYEA